MKLGAYGPAADAAARQHVDAQAGQLAAGDKWIWSGPLFDNKGNLMLDEGERFEHSDIRLRKIDWFVQGVEA